MWVWVGVVVAVLVGMVALVFSAFALGAREDEAMKQWYLSKLREAEDELEGP